MCRCPGFAASSEILLPRRMETPNPNLERELRGHRCIALLPVQLRDDLSQWRKTAVRTSAITMRPGWLAQAAFVLTHEAPEGATHLSPALQRGEASHPLNERERHQIISAGQPTRNEARSQSNSIVTGTPRGFLFVPRNLLGGLPSFGLTSFLGVYYCCITQYVMPPKKNSRQRYDFKRLTPND